MHFPCLFYYPNYKRRPARTHLVGEVPDSGHRCGSNHNHRNRHHSHRQPYSLPASQKYIREKQTKEVCESTAESRLGEFCRPANHVLSKHRKTYWRACRSAGPYRHSQPSMRLSKSQKKEKRKLLRSIKSNINLGEKKKKTIKLSMTSQMTKAWCLVIHT